MSQPRPHQFNIEGLPDGDYTFTVIDGVGSWGAAPSTLDDALVAEGSDGFELVFDDTGAPIYVED